MSSPADCPSQPMVPEIMPIFERLTGEELEEISLLVLWPNFDNDNIESFPQGWLGSWGEEEDKNLSRILHVCLRASVRDLVKFGFIPSFCIFYYFSTSASFSILLISP